VSKARMGTSIVGIMNSKEIEFPKEQVNPPNPTTFKTFNQRANS